LTKSVTGCWLVLDIWINAKYTFIKLKMDKLFPVMFYRQPETSNQSREIAQGLRQSNISHDKQQAT
jgi:hypothetical protein